MKSKKILVVDDEPCVRELLQEMLEPEGYEIITAANGYEALKATMETRLDLVFMDLMMPAMNGVDAIRAIKMSQPHLPVVILTGLGRNEMVEEGLREGAVGVLQKPVTTAKVLECIREALQQPN